MYSLERRLAFERFHRGMIFQPSCMTHSLPPQEMRQLHGMNLFGQVLIQLLGNSVLLRHVMHSKYTLRSPLGEL